MIKSYRERVNIERQDKGKRDQIYGNGRKTDSSFK